MTRVQQHWQGVLAVCSFLKGPEPASTPPLAGTQSQLLVDLVRPQTSWVQGGIVRPSPPQDSCHSLRQRPGWPSTAVRLYCGARVGGVTRRKRSLSGWVTGASSTTRQRIGQQMSLSFHPAWDIPLGNPRKHALKRSTERGAIDQGDSPPSLNAAYFFVTMLRLLDCLVTLPCRATSPTASI